MTRRSSLRAQAREIYREMAAQAPSASPQENPTALNLTEKVRALYEDSAVPVREIARLAGVTERTIYKYAAKGRWTPRYAWIDRGGAERRRRWRARQESPQDSGQVTGQDVAPDFVPVRGAGSRFIRRADRGKPIAKGLKATDPEGAARAGESCGAAASLSREAQAEAEAERRSEALNRAIECNNSALRNLREFHQGLDKNRPGPVDGRAGDILMRIVEMTLAQVQALVGEQSTSVMPGLDPGIHEASRRAEIHHGSPGQARR